METVYRYYGHNKFRIDVRVIWWYRTIVSIRVLILIIVPEVAPCTVDPVASVSYYNKLYKLQIKCAVRLESNVFKKILTSTIMTYQWHNLQWIIVLVFGYYLYLFWTVLFTLIGTVREDNMRMIWWKTYGWKKKMTT